MMKHFRAAALLAAGVLTASAVGFAACQPQGQHGNRTSVTFYANYISSEVSALYNEMIDTYNRTQGAEDKDNVWVNKYVSTGEISTSNLISMFNQRQCNYNIVAVSNMQFKSLMVSLPNALVKLDDYLDDTAKERLDYDQIPETSVNMWRMNSTKDAEDGKYHAGIGTDLKGIPFGNNPQVLLYNEQIFSEDLGMNIISVAEEDLDAYNTANDTQLMPHGYAEYSADNTEIKAWADAAGLKTAKNRAGDTVYKVFNNRIAMNWEEIRNVARDYMALEGNAGRYGYMSSWWFSYGWSVGGDCVGWDDEEGQYVLSLGDKDPNLLALEDVTVNGRAYKQGEVLVYEDMKYVHAHESEFEGKFTELPSMFDTFVEFNRLGVPTDKVVTNEGGESGNETLKGYGVAKNTVDNHATEFTSGNSPMVVDYYSTVLLTYQNSSIRQYIDIAPTTQYREYEGGSVYEENGTEYLKVIGEDGYTGELETVKNSKGEDVPVTGMMYAAEEPNSSALCIPANSDPEKYEAAFKFISWAAGPEGQAIMMREGWRVPNQTNLGMSDGFQNTEDNPVGNVYAASLASMHTYMGDWSYFENGTWIDGWSEPLNGEVRRGEKTLDYFIDTYTNMANTALNVMTIRFRR